MSYRVTGLDPAPFRPLFGLTDAELAARGVKRVIADANPGYPDRIEVRDAAPGESLLLLNYLHQPLATPYRASHAIFLREGAEQVCNLVDEIPEALRRRQISLRAFDGEGMMLDAGLAEGDGIEGLVLRLLADRAVSYLHAHYAMRGCYAARIDRTG